VNCCRLNLILTPCEGILLTMTVYKSVYISWNHNALGNTHWYAYTRTTMSSLLLRDGVLSYLVVLLALLFTAFGVFIPGVSQNYRSSSTLLTLRPPQYQFIALQSGYASSVPIIKVLTSFSRIAPAILSITTSQLQFNLRSALAKPRARFCSCPPSYSYPSPSRSTFFPLSIPSFGLGFAHHTTCALSFRSSTIDDHLFSSPSASIATSYDDDGECVFKTDINDCDDFYDYHDDDENVNEAKQPGKLAVFPSDCESLRLPSAPLPAHVSRTTSL
jgi:hypothetical protein